MKYKTANDFRDEQIRAVNALPLEVKKTFWKAMIKDGKNVGDARVIAGIKDVHIASQLVLMLHKHCEFLGEARPMTVDEIE